MESTSVFSRPRNLPALALLLLALVPVVLWPGDVSWLIDESRILAAAWHANHDGQLAAGGLYGNFGIRYGPLPTQIYQALLLLTHDPATLVVLRGLLCAGVTGGALLWLARTLALPAWFAAAVLVSPHVVAYQRILWDASFAMPIGALAFAAFADFLHTQRPRSLRVCVGACAVLPLIHPQALALAVPVFAWLGWRHRAALWRDRRALAVLAAVLCALHAVYFFEVAGQLFARFSGSVQRGYPGGGSRAASALAPLLGGRLLCGADYLGNLARPASLPALQAAAQWSARLIYPLIWLGLALSAARVWRMFRAARKTGSAWENLAPRDGVIAVGLAGLIGQALLCGLMRIPSLPQYFFGTFVLHALMAWLAVAALGRWRFGVLPAVLYAAGGAVLTVSAMLVIHAHGFEKPRWPTLGNDVEVVRALNRYSNTAVQTDVAVLQKNPQILRALRLLLPPSPDIAQTENERLFLNSPGGRVTGKILLYEGHALAGETPPTSPNYTALDVTPLPKSWVPDPQTW